MSMQAESCVFEDINKNNPKEKAPRRTLTLKNRDLGRVISVIGTIQNKKIEKKTPPHEEKEVPTSIELFKKELKSVHTNKPEPLFKDFKGGEWVLFPLRRSEQLCAAVCAPTDYQGGNCQLIIQKTQDPDSSCPEYAALILPLTDIYLIKSHFTFDKNEQPLEYIYPRETKFCSEFNSWLEDYPETIKTEDRSSRSTPKTIKKIQSQQHESVNSRIQLDLFSNDYQKETPKEKQSSTLPAVPSPEISPQAPSSCEDFFGKNDCPSYKSTKSTLPLRKFPSSKPRILHVDYQQIEKNTYPRPEPSQFPQNTPSPSYEELYENQESSSKPLLSARKSPSIKVKVRTGFKSNI